MKLEVALLLGLVSSMPMTYIFEAKRDNFEHLNASSATFDMRYIVDDQYYIDPKNENKTRPILFYTGNEGDVWTFY